MSKRRGLPQLSPKVQNVLLAVLAVAVLAGVVYTLNSGGTSGAGSLVLARDPEVVFVLGGTNDMEHGFPPARTIADLREIITRCHAANAKVILATIPPRADPAFAARIDALNQMITKLGTSTGSPVLNLHDAVSTAGGVYRPGMNSDEIHPSIQGQTAMAQAALRALSAA